MNKFYASVSCKNVGKVQILVLLLTSSLLTIHNNERRLFLLYTNIDKSHLQYQYKMGSNIRYHEEVEFIVSTSTSRDITTKKGPIKRRPTDQLIKEEDNIIGIHHGPFTNFIRINGTADIQSLLGSFWQLSLCGTFLHKPGEWIAFDDNETKSKFDHYPSTLFNLSFSCNDIFHSSNYGTGNYILLLYKIRMVARQIGNVVVHFSCTDAETYKNELILPWLMGEFSPTVWDRKNLTLEEECLTHSISYMLEDIKNDLRRMVVAVSGIPIGTNHASEQWAKEMLWSPSPSTSSNNKMQIWNPNLQQISVQPSLQYDDVAIHFRCGDIVDAYDTRFGFMKFSSISKYISPNAQSIGILTQPFDASGVQQSRSIDTTWMIHERCRLIVAKFQEFLQINHKNARISIHNHPNVTIVETYSRLIMANQTIVGTSSFGAIAGIVSFGTSYILNTNYYQGPNQWLLKPNITTLTENVILIDEPILLAKTVQEYWWSTDPAGQKILDWLQNDDAELNNVTMKNVAARI